MQLLGNLMFFTGLVVMLVYGIQLLILAFRESVMWGIGSMFIGLVGLIFVILHWEVTKGPFLRSLIGFGLVFFGLMLNGD